MTTANDVLTFLYEKYGLLGYGPGNEYEKEVILKLIKEIEGKMKLRGE